MKLSFIVFLFRYSQLETEVSLFSLFGSVVFEGDQIVYGFLEFLLTVGVAEARVLLYVGFIVSVELRLFLGFHLGHFFNLDCVLFFVSDDVLGYGMEFIPSEGIEFLRAIDIFFAQILILDVPDDFLE